MEAIQTITIIASILIPMFAGFGWIIHQIADMKTRLTVLETILAMQGFPAKPGKGHFKINEDKNG